MAQNRLTLVKVIFTRPIILNRFNMKEGETWNVRADRLKLSGFALGGGFVSPHYFEIVDFDGREDHVK